MRWDVFCAGERVGYVDEDFSQDTHGDAFARRAAGEKYLMSSKLGHLPLAKRTLDVVPTRPPIRYRPHKGLFVDSMAKLVHLENFKDLLAYLRKEPLTPSFKDSDIQIESYGFDEREGWNSETYLVILPGFGVFGYIDRLPDGYENCSRVHPKGQTG